MIYLGKVDEGGTLRREGNFNQWEESQGAPPPPLTLNALLYFNIIQASEQIYSMEEYHIALNSVGNQFE